MVDVLIRLTLSTNSVGPYSIYIDALSNVPVYTGLTRDQLIYGVTVTLQGSPQGIKYTIFVENNQIGCDDEVIAKDIVVYDDNVVTPTPTKSPILITPTPTNTPSNTPGNTPSNTPSNTPTNTPSNTPTNTPSNTP